MCKSFKEKITDTGIKVLENDDMTRLVLNFSNFDIAWISLSEWVPTALLPVFQILGTNYD